MEISSPKLANMVTVQQKTKLAEDLNWPFWKVEQHMTKKHRKISSTLSVIRKKQLETTMQYHYTFTRKAKLRRLEILNTNVDNWHSHIPQVGHKLVQLWKIVWHYLLKLNMHIFLEPAISLQSTFPKQLHT